nr:hypothetical protein [Tanacetum cinerariifolium]
YIDAEEHELGDLGEPANYKAALLDPEFEKWLNAMYVEMQSIKDNEVWVLVELPPNGKTVGSKWLFKKKTDMDGNVHIYKARLVAKGFTQTPRLIMRKPFLHITMLQSVKTYLGKCFAMKNLKEAAYILGIKIYRDRSKRLIGLCQSAYIEKILKRYCMGNSKRGSIPMQEKLKLSKSQGAIAIANESGITKGARHFRAKVHYLREEAVWVRKFISGLSVVPTIEEPISMYCDNTGAIAIANESRITKGARHFRAKVHYLRKVIEFGDIKLEKVHTDDNLVDPFTKALAFPKHSEHTRNIGMLPASSLM